MTIDWNAFSPWPALAGGMLIGAAAALFALLNGQIAGVSGVLGGLLRPVKADIGWQAAFVLGLVAAAPLAALFDRPALVQIDSSTGALIGAGLLVGLGTRYGSGCTSGHGVCGLARGSPRSAAATAAFMAAGFVTVFVLRHLVPL